MLLFCGKVTSTNHDHKLPFTTRTRALRPKAHFPPLLLSEYILSCTHCHDPERGLSFFFVSPVYRAFYRTSASVPDSTLTRDLGSWLDPRSTYAYLFITCLVPLPTY